MRGKRASRWDSDTRCHPNLPSCRYARAPSPARPQPGAGNPAYPRAAFHGNARAVPDGNGRAGFHANARAVPHTGAADRG